MFNRLEYTATYQYSGSKSVRPHTCAILPLVCSAHVVRVRCFINGFNYIPQVRMKIWLYVYVLNSWLWIQKIWVGLI